MKSIAVRSLKLALVLGFALNMTLVALGNIMDPEVNWVFVRHVLSMDLISPNAFVGRAIQSIFLQRLSYGLIILFESVSALMFWGAAVCMLARGEKLRELGVTIAQFALVVVVVLFFVFFYVIGGEYFQMWRAGSYDATPTAFRLFITASITFLILNVDENKP